RPRLEVGGEFAAADARVRPYAAVGFNQVIGGHKPGVLATFEAAGSLADPFATVQPLDEQAWEGEFGVEIVSQEGLSARIGYLGQWGEKVETHQVGVRLAVPF
ncbi:MAG: hypothetical protein ACK4Z5_05575, partial [Brevundimonas sp.]